MTKSRTRSLLLVSLLLLSAIITRAQVTTNRAVLQQASQLKAVQEEDVHRMLQSLAAKKGWPLTIKNKKGNMAYLRGVSSKGTPVYITTTENIISAATIRTNTLWAGGSTGLNLSGDIPALKDRIAVWDEGKVRPTHVELNGRVTQVDGSATLSDHSTHVSGTMIAAGVNPVAKGMAYGAQGLLAYDFDNDESEMMAAAAKVNGILVSNHSYAIIAGWYYNGGLSRWEWYGNPGDTVDVSFGLYDDHTRTWDSIAYFAPDYLICKASGNNRSENGPAVGGTYYKFNSSGNFVSATRPNNISSNDGYDIIATYGCAKNILTVGAINPIPGGYSTTADAVLTDFSSWGPTGDGRIKPDLVADGANVLSSISTTDNSYDVYSGTSMATPATAGSSFLLQQYYSRLHGGVFMHAATLKGLLIHTADEAGAHPGPDYLYGWGVINMEKAASVITSDTSAKRAQQIYQNQLTNTTHEADSVTIVASGTQPVTATISWTDLPGTPATNVTANFHDTGIKLVNDLDVRITDLTTGTVYQPWVLNPAQPSAPAAKGDNFRDNVEKIQVDSLIPGRSYKVKVTHKATLSSKSSPAGNQAYSLFISGGGGTAYCSSGGLAAGTAISNVAISNLNNATTGCTTYVDNMDKAAIQLPVGQALPINISYLTCSGTSTANVAVYIDFNNDGDYNDAGEMVSNNTSLLNATTTAAVFAGSITVPGTVKTGIYTRMRIVVQDGGSLATPAACGSFPNGETQDYRVVFTNPGSDIGIAALEAPTATSCANDSQIVSIRIRNYGVTAQNSVPVTTVVKDASSNTVATLSATCLDTIPGGSDVVFTYNTTFPAVAGQTYTFTSSTALGSDPNSSNNQNTSMVTISTGTSSATGTATICGANATTAALKSNASGNDQALWYDSPTATTPIAAGNNTTTTVISPTYYLGVNDLKAKLGPPNKIAAYTGGAGAYFRLGGDFIKITTGVPLTIESARMYFAHNGQVSLTLATLISSTSKGFSYIPLYNTTIDVYATKPVPDSSLQINVAAGDNTDTGGIFNLNIPVPTPGNYIIIIDCSAQTSAFINVFSTTSTTTVPYPVSIPGIMSITGHNLNNGGADSLTAYKRFWFPFYDIGIRLTGCIGTARTPITANTISAPVISLNGNVFTSSSATGNQWYRGDTIISGATGQTDTAIYTGNYKTVINDLTTGCSLSSNVIHFLSTGTNDVSGAAIGLTVSPNPNNGVFQLAFNMTTQDNTSIVLLNTLGQKVYEEDYTNFIGAFSSTINAGSLASGMYVLKIIHGNNNYIRKIMVKK